MHDSASPRRGASRTTEFLASTRPNNFELTLLGMSLFMGIGIFLIILTSPVSLGPLPKSQRDHADPFTPEQDKDKKPPKTDAASGKSGTAETDVEAQNGEGVGEGVGEVEGKTEAQNGEGEGKREGAGAEGLGLPPYTPAETPSRSDAPQVATTGDDMVISFPGWQVQIAKSERV
jgi:hypothetical protein